MIGTNPVMAVTNGSNALIPEKYIVDTCFVYKGVF